MKLELSDEVIAIRSQSCDYDEDDDSGSETQSRESGRDREYTETNLRLHGERTS